MALGILNLFNKHPSLSLSLSLLRVDDSFPPFGSSVLRNFRHFVRSGFRELKGSQRLKLNFRLINDCRREEGGRSGDNLSAENVIAVPRIFVELWLVILFRARWVIIGDAFVPLALINCWRGGKKKRWRILARNLSSSFVPGKMICI